MRTTTWLGGLVFAMGCGKQLNPEYCLHHPDELCYDAGLVFVDAAPPCSDNSTCTEQGLGVCDTSRGTCVECTMADHAACTGATNQCSADDTCVGCTDDNQCTSHLCVLATGTCAPVGALLFVTVDGTGDCRASTTPCMLPVALATARTDSVKSGYMGSVIHIDGGTYATGPNTLDIPNLTIVATAGQQVILTSNDVDGPVLDITKGPVEIDDVTVQAAKNDDAIACTNSTVALNHVTVQNNPKKGLITNNCNITIDRSTFTKNNDNAIYIRDGQLSIHHNFIFDNGNDELQSAAVTLVGHAGGEFRFNTLAFNTAKQGDEEGHHGGGNDYPAGLECLNDHGVTTRDSLFADNKPATFATDPFKNACGNVFGFALANWIGNASEVKFVSTTDLHLTDQSPDHSTQQTPAVRNNANTSCSNANLKHDIDGQARPYQNACDYGADEYMPGAQ